MFCSSRQEATAWTECVTSIVVLSGLSGDIAKFDNMISGLTDHLLDFGVIRLCGGSSFKLPTP